MIKVAVARGGHGTEEVFVIVKTHADGSCADSLFFALGDMGGDDVRVGFTDIGEAIGEEKGAVEGVKIVMRFGLVSADLPALVQGSRAA